MTRLSMSVYHGTNAKETNEDSRQHLRPEFRGGLDSTMENQSRAIHECN